MRASRRGPLTAIVVGVVALAVLCAAPLAAARTDNRSKPVVFVHGLELGGDSNCDDWNPVTSAFRDWGHTGEFMRVRYYDGDTNCDHNISHHGDHSKHYASGHQNGSHTTETNIRHLAYHLAWTIRAHWSIDDRAVDVVAHSMGGLMIRYAAAQADRGHEDFPANFDVEDAVTMGTPHGGHRSGFADLCNNLQCDQMSAGSEFLKWLEDYAWNPQPDAGTDWSTFGSDDDNQVAADRAAATADDRNPTHQYMGSCHKVWYTGANDIEHGDFRKDNSSSTTANVYRRNCPDDFVYDSSSHWPIRRADLAVAFGSH